MSLAPVAAGLAGAVMGRQTPGPFGRIELNPLDAIKEPDGIVIISAVAQLDCIKPGKLVQLRGQFLLPERFRAID